MNVEEFLRRLAARRRSRKSRSACCGPRSRAWPASPPDASDRRRRRRCARPSCRRSVAQAGLRDHRSGRRGQDVAGDDDAMRQQGQRKSASQRSSVVRKVNVALITRDRAKLIRWDGRSSRGQARARPGTLRFDPVLPGRRPAAEAGGGALVQPVAVRLRHGLKRCCDAELLRRHPPASSGSAETRGRWRRGRRGRRAGSASAWSAWMMWPTAMVLTPESLRTPSAYGT